MNTMKKPTALGRWLWWFSLIAAAIILYKSADGITGVMDIFYTVIAIFAPFIIGLFIAFLLYAPCNRLETLIRRSRSRILQRCARVFSLTVCYLLFFAVIAGLLVLLLPALYNAVAGFVKSLPTYYAALSERLTAITAEGGWLDRLNLSESIKTIYESAYNMLLSLASTENVLNVMKGAVSVTSSLLNIVMALIVSIYMLAQRESLLRALRSLLEAICNQRILRLGTRYLHLTASIFYRYLYGTLIDIAVVSVMMAVGLTLFGVPRSVLLGCLIGIMNFIPYFGAFIAACVVILITLLTKNIYTAIGVTAYIIVMQQIDANIIQPKIVGESVGLRPIYVLLAITVGGALFGFWGILLGVPTMAVLLTLVHDFIAYRTRKKAESAQKSAD